MVSIIKEKQKKKLFLITSLETDKKNSNKNLHKIIIQLQICKRK